MSFALPSQLEKTRAQPPLSPVGGEGRVRGDPHPCPFQGEGIARLLPPWRSDFVPAGRRRPGGGLLVPERVAASDGGASVGADGAYPCSCAYRPGGLMFLVWLVGIGWSASAVDPRPITRADSVVANYAQDWGRPSDGMPRIIFVARPDGHVVWSEDRIRGGAPYLAGQISPARIAAVLERVDRDGVFHDKRLALASSLIPSQSHPVAGDVLMKAGTLAWRETPSTVIRLPRHLHVLLPLPTVAGVRVSAEVAIMATSLSPRRSGRLGA